MRYISTASQVATTVLVICFSLCYPVLATAKKAPVTKPVANLGKTAIATPSKNALTPTQQVAAENALKSLRKLKAATDVGVSRSEYQNRLIDTKAEVDEDLRSIPSGKIQDNITDAMQAYQDASTVWNECEQLKNRGDILKGASGPIITKYALTLPKTGKDGEDAFDKDNAELTQLQQSAEATSELGLARQKELLKAQEDDMYAMIRINDTDEKKLLSGIWNVANQKQKDAEATTSQQK